MNTRLIETWISQHEPKGLEKLAAGAEVSIGTLNKIRHRDHAPGVDIARRMAEFMGVTLDLLCAAEESAQAKETA